jgi:hypothetical protein
LAAGCSFPDPSYAYRAVSAWTSALRSASVALWASAFEILRPAKNQDYKGVSADLANITWNLTAETGHAALPARLAIWRNQPPEKRHAAWKPVAAACTTGSEPKSIADVAKK